MTAPFGAREPRRIARPPSETSGFDERADDVVVEDLGALEGLRDGQAGDGRDVVQVEAGHEAAEAAGLEEVLHEVLAGRADVGEHRDGAGELVEVVEGEVDAGSAGHGDEVDDRVGGAARARGRLGRRSRRTRARAAARAGRRCGGPRRRPCAGGRRRPRGSRRRPAW